MTPPDIPITNESYGIIHGDAHCANIFLEFEGPEDYEMTVIDFD